MPDERLGYQHKFVDELEGEQRAVFKGLCYILLEVAGQLKDNKDLNLD